MSNIKEVRIVTDVPFDYLNWKPRGEGLPPEDIAVVATLLMPSIGLRYNYRHLRS